MYPKSPVLKVRRLFLTPFRNLNGLTPLEKFERLRELCCTSLIAKKRMEQEAKLRPQVPEPTCCPTTCTGCVKPECMDIRCKTAMVLGGASGIGLETADQLLQNSVDKVIIADINQEAGLNAVKKLCTAHGNNKAVFLKTDMAEKPSIEMAFREVYRYFTQIDIFVNSAGIYNETPQCWDKMVRNNLLGCIRATLLGYKYMGGNTLDECGQGSVIVNVSSYGPVANVPSMPLFSAASNGIIGLTSSLGTEYHYSKSKVRFVTVCPSCTDSGLLKNMSRNHYDSSWAGLSSSAIKCCTKQSAKIVGKAIVNAIRFGTNGSTYVIKEGRFYKFEMPDYMKIMKEETVLW